MQILVFLNVTDTLFSGKALLIKRNKMAKRSALQTVDKEGSIAHKRNLTALIYRLSATNSSKLMSH